MRKVQGQPAQDIQPPNRETESRQRERERAARMQEELLKEIDALKGSNLAALQRPGTASADVGAVRAERDQLARENLALKQQIQEQNAQIQGLMAGQPAKGYDAAGPESGETDVKRLQKKLQYYKKQIEEGERERASLKSRVTMAETQVRALQAHLDDAQQSKAATIKDLKTELASRGVDISRY